MDCWVLYGNRFLTHWMAEFSRVNTLAGNADPKKAISVTSRMRSYEIVRDRVHLKFIISQKIIITEQFLSSHDWGISSRVLYYWKTLKLCSFGIKWCVKKWTSLCRYVYRISWPLKETGKLSFRFLYINTLVSRKRHVFVEKNA